MGGAVSGETREHDKVGGVSANCARDAGKLARSGLVIRTL